MIIDFSQLTPPGFHFEPSDHSYWYGNERFISVTQVCSEVGAYQGENYFTDSSRDLGGKIHLATEYADRGVLDEDTLDPKLSGYVKSWRRICERMRFTILLIERPLVSLRYRFAGTMDRLVIDGDGHYWIPDIKHGSVEPVHQIQTAGYYLLATEALAGIIPLKIRRAAVYLQADGGEPKWEAHDKAGDIPQFMAFLATAQWKRRYVNK